MATTYRQKLFDEINSIPENLIPLFYKVISTLRSEMIQQKIEVPKRGSLRGIWKDAAIDDLLISEAKKSLFSYESKDA